MIAELMNEYIRRRMAELGHTDHYHIRFRHFVLAATEVRTIPHGMQLFILVEPTENLRIKSEMAVYDLQDITVNEIQYEHQGAIELTNYSLNPLHVKMIQVFFKTH